MVTSQILPDVGYSWTKTVGWCHKSERGWVRTCFQSLGRDASGQTRGNVARIERICALAGTMARECIRGAAADLASNDANGRRASRLCDASPAGMRAYCFYATGSILGSFSYAISGRRTLCAAITSAYFRPCFAGATGRPVYAECGGLMYLADSLELDGTSHPLCGVLPFSTRMPARRARISPKPAPARRICRLPSMRCRSMVVSASPGTMTRISGSSGQKAPRCCWAMPAITAN